MTLTTPDLWYCDSCGESITEPGKSLVIWREDADGPAHDFRLVHKSTDGRKCDPGFKGGYSPSNDISIYLGPEGTQRLLSHLSSGPLMTLAQGPSSRTVDAYDFVDVFRRLQTPYYEEARRHFGCPAVQQEYEGAGEALPYLPKSLEHIATLCVDCEVGH